MTNTKSITSPMFKAAEAMLLAFAMATTNARMLHAVTSSVAAQAMAVLPKAVLVSPRSSRIRASTGKAVIDIDTPMKRANGR